MFGAVCDGVFVPHRSCSELFVTCVFVPHRSCSELFVTVCLLPHRSCSELFVTCVFVPHRSCSELFVTCAAEDARIWHAGSGQELLRMVVPNMVCQCVQVSADGSMVITGQCHSRR